MKIKNKTKYGSFGMWLLADPKAFQVTMLISAVGATIIFTLLAILGWFFSWTSVITIIWTVFALLAGYKSFKYIRARRRMGDDQFAGYTLGNFMNVEQVEENEDDREGNNGEQSEKFCSEQSNADDEQPTREKYKDTSRRILESEKEPEPADNSFFDLIQESNQDEPKF